VPPTRCFVQERARHAREILNRPSSRADLLDIPATLRSRGDWQGAPKLFHQPEVVVAMRPTPSRPRSRRHRLTAAAATLVVAVLGSLLIAGGAPASRSQSMTFDATGELLNGSSQRRQEVILDLQILGVDTLRIVVPWRFYAPDFNSSTKPAGFDATNPSAYPGGVFSGLDEIVRLARGVGLKVLLTPSMPMPDWASRSGNSDITSPKPAEFGDFVQALGRRYSGGFSGLPRVNFWAMGNELNIAIFIKPHPSGKLYREMFLAGQRGLRNSGHGGDPILIGETAPSAGRTGTDPLAFLRQVLCLNKNYRRVGNCAPISADGWAHHPYNPKDPPFDRTPFHNILALGNIGRLTTALGKAARAGATRGRLPVYVTEFGTESKPDPIGVSLKAQAEHNAIAEYMAWRNPQIKAFNQYLLRDDTAGTFAFQTGLRKGNGAKKPSFDAFRMPLMAKQLSSRGRGRAQSSGRRGGARVLIWGLVRPGGRHQVTVRRRSGGGGSGSVLRRVRTNGRGYFTFVAPFRRGSQYRSTTRVRGVTISGAWVRSYKFR
jgi:hypothetical protein